MYGGTAEGALQHFEGLGHECPQHHNPAEFLADLISIDQSSEGAIEDSQARLDGLVEKRTGAGPLLSRLRMWARCAAAPCSDDASHMRKCMLWLSC